MGNVHALRGDEISRSARDKSLQAVTQLLSRLQHRKGIITAGHLSDSVVAILIQNCGPKEVAIFYTRLVDADLQPSVSRMLEVLKYYAEGEFGHVSGSHKVSGNVTAQVHKSADIIFRHLCIRCKKYCHMTAASTPTNSGATGAFGDGYSVADVESAGEAIVWPSQHSMQQSCVGKEQDVDPVASLWDGRGPPHNIFSVLHQGLRSIVQLHATFAKVASDEYTLHYRARAPLFRARAMFELLSDQDGVQHCDGLLSSIDAVAAAESIAFDKDVEDVRDPIA